MTVTVPGYVYRITAVLWLLAGGGCSPAPRFSSPARPVVDIVELSAAEAARHMSSGALTSRSLTDAYLRRIAAIDDDGPRLNAVIQANPKAIEEAESLDRERQGGTVRGPLHGIPVLVKDNIDVAGLVNSAGSLALGTHTPANDAFLVQRLRRAGLVVLGKANLSEWANFRSTRSTSGWSSRGGQTRNPYALSHSPCGSSSGSAVAAAASLTAVAVGTETDGSIICPAAVNGIVGLKPTVGIVSRAGIIPISVSQDTAGPMGRTVTDVAMLLTALVAIDPSDPAGTAASGRIDTDYASGLSADALRGRRFGLLRQAMGHHPDVDAASERVVTMVRQAGGDVVDVTVGNYGSWDPLELEVLLYEFKDGLNRYLTNTNAPARSLADLIAWNKANAAHVMPFFGQDLFERAEAKGPLTDRRYLAARDGARRLALDALMSSLSGSHVEALMAPSVSPAWPIDPVLGDRFLGGGYGIAAVAGTPSITLPVGTSQGLPLGFTLMGPAYSEKQLLEWAFALETLIKGRTAPQFKTRSE